MGKLFYMIEMNLFDEFFNLLEDQFLGQEKKTG
jgi:hypothetical protein